jgi:hypothetical protein
MSDAENQNGVQTTTSAPAPSPSPANPERQSARDTAGGGEFAALRPFPTNPYQSTEVEPRRSPIAELIGGAIFGAVAGAILTCTDPVERIVTGIVFGSVLGMLDGFWVSLLFERAGFLSAWTVAANVVRIPFCTVGCVAFPYFLIRRMRRRDLKNR